MSIQKQARFLLTRQRQRQSQRQLSLLTRVTQEVSGSTLGINPQRKEGLTLAEQ